MMMTMTMTTMMMLMTTMKLATTMMHDTHETRLNVSYMLKWSWDGECFGLMVCWVLWGVGVRVWVHVGGGVFAWVG